MRAAVTVPVIASGGAGKLADFAPAVQAGADAVLAASVFHFGELTIGAGQGQPARRQHASRCADRIADRVRSGGGALPPRRPGSDGNPRAAHLPDLLVRSPVVDPGDLLPAEGDQGQLLRFDR